MGKDKDLDKAEQKRRAEWEKKFAQEAKKVWGETGEEEKEFVAWMKKRM